MDYVGCEQQKTLKFHSCRLIGTGSYIGIIIIIIVIQKIAIIYAALEAVEYGIVIKWCAQ